MVIIKIKQLVIFYKELQSGFIRYKIKLLSQYLKTGWI